MIGFRSKISKSQDLYRSHQAAPFNAFFVKRLLERILICTHTVSDDRVPNDLFKTSISVQ